MEKMNGTVIRCHLDRGFVFARGEDNYVRFIHARDMMSRLAFDVLREGSKVRFIPIDLSTELKGGGNHLRGIQVEVVE